MVSQKLRQYLAQRIVGIASRIQENSTVRSETMQNPRQQYPQSGGPSNG